VEKIMNGVWFTKKNTELKTFVASYRNRRYNILATSQTMASEKAVDHFGKVDFQIQEL
jgi:hypothetical protein